MIIKTFSIKNFKKFRNETFEFSEGLNIILGPNEAGKSSLAEALITCLFTDPTTRSKKFFNNSRPWGKRKEDKPIFELEFIEGEGEYILRKNFSEREVLLKEIHKNKSITGKTKVANFIEKSLGFPSEDIYRSTGFIGQKDILKVQKSDDFITAVQNASSGEGRDGDIQYVISEIDKEIRQLQKGLKSPSKSPGPIKQTKDALEKKRFELSELDEKWKQIKKKITNLEKKRHKRKKLKNKIEVLEKVLKNHEKYKTARINLEETIKKIKVLSKDIKNIEELDKEIDQMNFKLKKYEKLEGVDLDDLLLNFANIHNDIRLRKETIKQIEQNMERIGKEGTHKYRKPILGITMSVFLILMGVSIYRKSVFLFIVDCAIATAVILFDFFVINKKARKRKTLKQKQEDLNEIAERDEKKLESIMSEYNISTKEQFLSIKSEINSLNLEIEKAKANKLGILGGKTLERLKDEQIDLLTMKKDIEINDLTNEILNSQLDPEEYNRKKIDLERFTKEFKEVHEEILNLEGKLNESGTSLDNLRNLKAEIEELEKNLKYYNYRLKVLIGVEKYLQKALEDTSSLAINILRKDIEQYFPKLTKQNYNKVRIDKKFNLEIYSNKLDDWLDPVDNLSIGTIDQIYFLFRLAFVKLLVKNKKTILILDDPFASYDEDRLENVFNILDKEQQQFQILLLTHETRYKKYGKVTQIY
ncbi:AAA family ATPase [Candidatus Dojkabacteria bacterium]|nr:AAA family ATPase [Candidatus Dojkabacteria bacterium]